MEALWDLLLAGSAQRTSLAEADRVVQARLFTTKSMVRAVTHTFIKTMEALLAITPGIVIKMLM